jgi:hypothetical protein
LVVAGIWVLVVCAIAQQRSEIVQKQTSSSVTVAVAKYTNNPITVYSIELSNPK